MVDRLTVPHGSTLGDSGRLIAHLTAIFMVDGARLDRWRDRPVGPRLRRDRAVELVVAVLDAPQRLRPQALLSVLSAGHVPARLHR